MKLIAERMGGELNCVMKFICNIIYIAEYSKENRWPGWGFTKQ